MHMTHDHVIYRYVSHVTCDSKQLTYDPCDQRDLTQFTKLFMNISFSLQTFELIKL